MTDNSRAVNELIARSGILQQLAAEDEVRRSAQHADLRKRKAAALALFQKQKPLADAAVVAAEAKAADAHKMANQAHADHIAAREKLSTIMDTLRGTTDPIDKEMLACYPPAIDEFEAELKLMRAECSNLHRNIPDPNGPFKDPNGNRFRDNYAEVQARVIAINAAIDACARLKIDPNTDDAPSALSAIRATIPKA